MVLVNGLYAFYGIGGITVEVFKTLADSKLGMVLGQQGNVMKESMSCVKLTAWNLIPQGKRHNKEGLG